MSLQGKIAIVTGASRGIGRSIALRLAEDGAAVAVNYYASKDSADTVVAEIVKAGGKAVAIQADVTVPEQITRLYDQTEKLLGGKPNIVIANAFKYTNANLTFSSVADSTLEQYESVFNANSRGTFFTLVEAAKRVPDGGHIIVISSVATVANRPLKNVSLYSAHKSAIETFAHTLAVELGSRQIAVNIVSPGATDTDLLADSFRSSAAGSIAFGRLGLPKDISNIVSLIVSKDNTWITGNNFVANGGFT